MLSSIYRLETNLGGHHC